MSCIWRFMYRDVLEPGDTFPMMMRKMGMALSAIAGNLVMFRILYFTSKPRTNETHAIYFYSSAIPDVVILIGVWIYVKWTHTAPTWLIVFMINSISVVTLFSMLSVPNAPYVFIQIGMIIAVLICKVHSVNHTVPVTSVLIWSYNSSLGRMGAPYPLMMLPGGGDQTPCELVSLYVICIACLFISLYGVHLQSEEFTPPHIPRRFSRQ